MKEYNLTSFIRWPFLVLASSLLPAVACADTMMPEVVAIAPIPSSWSVTIVTPGMPGTINGQNDVTTIAQLNMVGAAIQDVRCLATGDLRRVTSLSEVIDRWLAATDLYNKIAARKANDPLRRVITGTAVDPTTGKTFKAFSVTYADGGTEKWMIFPTPASSIKLFDNPLPGSLVEKDGVVKPSPYCKGIG